MSIMTLGASVSVWMKEFFVPGTKGTEKYTVNLLTFSDNHRFLLVQFA